MKLPRFFGKLRKLKSLLSSIKGKRLWGSRKPLLLRQIVGKSMLPKFEDGRVVVASGWFGTLKSDDVVIIKHDGREKIKRIHKIDDDRLYVIGDNAPASTDSRDFGWLPCEIVQAKVLWPRTTD